MSLGIPTLRRDMTLGALAGVVLGALSTGVHLLTHLPDVRSTWLAVGFGAGLLGAAGGVIFGAAGVVFRRLRRAFGLSLQAEPQTSETPPEVHRAARWGAWFAGTVGLTGALAMALRIQMDLQDAAFAADLLTLWTLLAVAALPAATVVMLRLGTKAGSWLHERGRFPGSQSASLVALLMLLVFVGGWLYWKLNVHGGAFGAMGWLPLLIILALIFRLFELVERHPRFNSYARNLRLQLGVLGVVTVLVIGAAVGLRVTAPAGAVLEAVPVVRLPLNLAVAVTDVDRDGHSALFGQGDCAGFDGDVYPGAQEHAANGVDENCDGEDDVAAQVVSKQIGTFTRTQPTDRIQPYNVLLVVVDALRADFLGSKKDSRSTTPFLDRFAKRSLFFKQAYSQSSSTRISFPSFLSGRIPGNIEWKKRGRRHQIQRSQPMLQQALKKEGYRTGFVATKWFSQHVPSLSDSFDVFRDAWMGRPYQKARRASAASTTTRALEFIEAVRSGQEPFFLTLYYEGPHAPYHDNKAEGFPSAGKSQKARYVSEISLVDHQLGFLLSYLRAKPKLWRNTLVVVTADHGEEFGEHGGKHHSRTCYAESLHVPLLVRIPKVKGRRVEEMVSLVDIAPTVLELIGAKKRLPQLDGISLLHALDEGLPSQRPSFCAIFGDSKPQSTLQGSVRAGELTLMRTRSGTLLFNRGEDPVEQRALAEGEFVEARARLRAQLDESLSLKFLK